MRSLAAVFLLLLGANACAQDPEFVRMWDDAQRQRPRTIGSTARIAPVKEPGTPMVIRGRLFRQDGVTPARDLIVFAYQTDASGVYHRRGESGWRLRGWARTDVNGRFEFHTIRPAPYPGTRNPAHIHLHVEGPRLPRRWLPELQFLDDPFVGDAAKRESAAAGAFGSVRPVTTRGGVQHVELNLRVSDDGRF